MPDISKLELLKRLGFASPVEELLQALVDAGLTHARKQRISLDKVDAAALVLAQHFIRVCQRGDCQSLAAPLLESSPGMRLALPVERRDCVICGGSTISRALENMLGAMLQARWTRLCVVGGSPASHRRLIEELGSRVELRLVDGTRGRGLRQARLDAAWAHCTVIWGATLLDHKVSDMYKGLGCLVINGRSIEELAGAVEALARRT